MADPAPQNSFMVLLEPAWDPTLGHSLTKGPPASGLPPSLFSSLLSCPPQTLCLTQDEPLHLTKCNTLSQHMALCVLNVLPWPCFVHLFFETQLRHTWQRGSLSWAVLPDVSNAHLYVPILSFSISVANLITNIITVVYFSVSPIRVRSWRYTYISPPYSLTETN